MKDKIGPGVEVQPESPTPNSVFFFLSIFNFFISRLTSTQFFFFSEWEKNQVRVRVYFLGSCIYSVTEM